jgi:hypothetical protein
MLWIASSKVATLIGNSMGNDYSGTDPGGGSRNPGRFIRENRRLGFVPGPQLGFLCGLSRMTNLNTILEANGNCNC